MRSLLRSDLLLRRRDHRTLSSLAGSIPVPLALGADFEHCVVQLGGFELVCERYIRDRVLIETPQGLADLYRFEGRSHSIKHSERRADENQAARASSCCSASERMADQSCSVSSPPARISTELRPASAKVLWICSSVTICS